jgi:hypothetical protein
MRIVSFLRGARPLGSSLLFFYRFWAISARRPRSILLAAPLLFTLTIELAARREADPLFASLLALVASPLLFSTSRSWAPSLTSPSPKAFLAWASFALLLAYAYGLRLLLVAGMTCLMGYLAAVGTWAAATGSPSASGRRTSSPPGAARPGPLIPHRHHPHFAGIYRVYGLLAVFIAILILANWGQISYLPWKARNIEYLYQVAGFALASGVIWLGLRHLWAGMTNLGCTFFVLYLYTKLFDWWWDWMPKYLFFLLLGLIAIGLLVFLKRLRVAGREVTA